VSAAAKFIRWKSRFHRRTSVCVRAGRYRPLHPNLRSCLETLPPFSSNLLASSVVRTPHTGSRPRSERHLPLQTNRPPPQPYRASLFSHNSWIASRSFKRPVNKVLYVYGQDRAGTKRIRPCWQAQLIVRQCLTIFKTSSFAARSNLRYQTNLVKYRTPLSSNNEAIVIAKSAAPFGRWNIH